MILSLKQKQHQQQQIGWMSKHLLPILNAAATMIFDDWPSLKSSVWIVGVTAVLYQFYRYVRHRQSHWKRLGVPGPKPTFLLGTELIPAAFRPWPEFTMEGMRKYGKLYGGYVLLKPVLIILKPELIKMVLVKDFHCFVNRGEMRLQHETLVQNLVFAQDEKWKRMRTIASPAFASGKLRKMTPLMNRCVERLYRCFDRLIQKQDGKFETKKIIAGLTMDVIAVTSFGTEIDPYVEDDQDQNPFIKFGLRLFDADPLRMLASIVLPKIILKWLNIRTLSSSEPFDYFMNITKEIIRQRKTNPDTRRSDLLQFLLDSEATDQEDFQNLTASVEETHESTPESNSTTTAIKKKLTETEIIANSIFFLIAGFDTTASTISHCLYLLAKNPEAQERLRNELNEKLDQLPVDSEEYFDRVMSAVHLPYFDSVIKETLRIYPALTTISRRVTAKNYLLGSIPLQKDQMVMIPVHAIHHCPDYYSDPEHFNPDRFLPENRHQIEPFTYLPFGLGPRNCIGMRFAYQEIKLSLAGIIPRYRFETTPETPNELKFRSRAPLLSSYPFQLKVSKI